MEAKDKSNGFDFEGIYTEIILLKKIEYRMLDNREVEIIFNAFENQVEVIITLEAEMFSLLKCRKLAGSQY